MSEGPDPLYLQQSYSLTCISLLRISVTPGHGYLEALTAPNAKVVTEGIEKVVENGIVSRDGVLHEIDVIVVATGYDTSYVPRFPILGPGGVNLQDKWREEGAAAYLSVAVAGFPNYFCKFRNIV